MGRKGKKGNAKHKRHDTNWPEIITDNENFQKYYKLQNIIHDDNDWNEFWNSLKRELPTAFRITGTRSQAKEIQDTIQTEFIPLLQNIELDGRSVEPPCPIPWYPDDLAYSLDVPKAILRRNPEFKKFQSFLVQETEVGNICRQEAVSMIPPLFLQVEPHHKVIDMCAAPGSKTCQLIEALHSFENKQPIPTGIIIANDSDCRRSHLLVHQIKRLHSPSLIVTNLDASVFPNIKYNGTNKLQFDRVLCDVPCSGDGTVRKNRSVWMKWSPSDGLGLHPLQSRILQRGIQSACVGGRIVYSTCSMNPIENEAVIASVLKKLSGSVKLVDVSNYLPNLKRCSGLYTWKVLNKKMEEITPETDEPISATVFPPTESEANEMHLERCMRVYPHLQNTGGFFIAVLEKISDSETSQAKTKRSFDETGAPQVKKQKTERDDNLDKTNFNESSVSQGVVIDVQASITGGESTKTKLSPLKEEPFTFLPEDHQDVQKIVKFFDIQSSFPLTNFLIRSKVLEKPRTLYFVSDFAKDIVLQNDADRMRFVQGGIRIFVRNESSKNDSQLECLYRIQMDGIQVMAPHLGPARIVDGTLNDLRQVLENEYILLEKLEENFRQSIEPKSIGCCVLRIAPGPKLPYVGYYPLWRAKQSINLQLAKQDKTALYARLYGQTLSVIVDTRSKRKGNEIEKGSNENVDLKNGETIDKTKENEKENKEIKDNINEEV